jgi:hypothetical protein
VNPILHSRSKYSSNQASQPPHVDSLAPATNLQPRLLFLPSAGDYKWQSRPDRNFFEDPPSVLEGHAESSVCEADKPHELTIILAVGTNLIGRKRFVGIAHGDAGHDHFVFGIRATSRTMSERMMPCPLMTVRGRDPTRPARSHSRARPDRNGTRRRGRGFDRR